MTDATASTKLSERDSPFPIALPAITLMVLAPLVAEVLPGATRVSVIHFVFPIEVLIWGGGTVVIRDVCRRLDLGWLNMLLLAASLAIAEEWLIQQTSLAPVVIKIKGVEYARAWNVNYVYFLWALIYEVAFVVFVPIGLAELIFRSRRREPWLNRAGFVAIGLLFFPACGMAWFSWTQVARPKVFHLDLYNPPLNQIALALGTMAILIALAVGPTREVLSRRRFAPLTPLHPLALFAFAAAATVVLFGVEVLAFGIAPTFPPLAAVAIGVALITVLLALIPRFYAHETWTIWHEVGLLYGAVIANMAIMFIAFLDATPLDFWGKVVLDALAVALLARLAWRLSARQDARA